MNATASEIYGLLITKLRAPEHAVDRQIIYYMKKHCVNGAATFHLPRKRVLQSSYHMHLHVSS